MNRLTGGYTPQELVTALNRFIVGQQEAKKAVANAIRGRERRKYIEMPMRDEISPKNILMIGKTGVGKTEMIRRVAKLLKSPFIKVEATKFTEIGYVGRDVESIIRDLVDNAISILRLQAKESCSTMAYEKALERVLDALVGKNATTDIRQQFKTKIASGKLDSTEVDIQILDNSSLNTPTIDIPGMPGAAMGVLNLGEMLGKAFGNNRTKTKKLTVKDALKKIISEEADKLVDEEKVTSRAVSLVENEGIVFIDEIDKIASKANTRNSEISREGVQRDLLPLIEGTIVNTKHGPVRTDHILFIASGAFQISSPSDLLPELQGRLPIRVELSPLTEDDLVRILKEPECSLIKQYIALIATEGVALEFTDDGIHSIASYAFRLNAEVENIGARRLHTILEKVLEEVNFTANDLVGQKIVVDSKYVDCQLESILKRDDDLQKFIL